MLTSDNLNYQIAQAKVIAANPAWQVAQQPFSQALDEQGGALKRLESAAQQQVESLLRQQARLTLTAPFSGRVADVSDALKFGTVVVQGEQLMQVLGKEGVRGEGWGGRRNGNNPAHGGGRVIIIATAGLSPGSTQFHATDYLALFHRLSESFTILVFIFLPQGDCHHSNIDIWQYG